MFAAVIATHRIPRRQLHARACGQTSSRHPAHDLGAGPGQLAHGCVIGAGASPLLLIFTDLPLAWAASVTTVLLGIALWGLHMDSSQGILAAPMADTTPAELKGSAFGLFNLASSTTAGWLWQSHGAAVAFYAGAALAAVALLLLGLRRTGQWGCNPPCSHRSLPWAVLFVGNPRQPWANRANSRPDNGHAFAVSSGPCCDMRGPR